MGKFLDCKWHSLGGAFTIHGPSLGWGTLSSMLIILWNGHGDQSSNLEQGC